MKVPCFRKEYKLLFLYKKGDKLSWILHGAHSMEVGSIYIYRMWYDVIVVEDRTILVLIYTQHTQTLSVWILQ